MNRGGGLHGKKDRAAGRNQRRSEWAAQGPGPGGSPRGRPQPPWVTRSLGEGQSWLVSPSVIWLSFKVFSTVLNSQLRCF